MRKAGKPAVDNGFLSTHAQLLAASYWRLTGKELLNVKCAREDVPIELICSVNFGVESESDYWLARI